MGTTLKKGCKKCLLKINLGSWGCWKFGVILGFFGCLLFKTSHQLLHLFRRMLQRFFCCDLWVKCSFNKCKSLAVDLDHVKPKWPKSVEFVLCTISVQIFHWFIKYLKLIRLKMESGYSIRYKYTYMPFDYTHSSVNMHSSALLGKCTLMYSALPNML